MRESFPTVKPSKRERCRKDGLMELNRPKGLHFLEEIGEIVADNVQINEIDRKSSDA